MLLQDLMASLFRVLVGVGLGFLFGLLLAFVRFQLPSVLQKNLLTSFVFEFWRFPPPIAWLPFVIILVGVGPLSAVLVVFLAVFPIVATQMYDGLHRLPLGWTRFFDSLGEGRIFRLRFLYFPALRPQLFTSLRLGLGMGWMSVIAAEMIGGQSGLGYSIQLHRIYMQYDLMFLNILMIAAVGFLFHFILVRLEDRLIPWQPRRGDQG